MGNTIPGNGGPDFCKQVEQGMKNNPVSSTPPWSLHQLLPPGFCPI